MKTIGEWFALLPEPFRTEALDNCPEDDLDVTAASMGLAISAAFVWSTTVQGHEYWQGVVDKFGGLQP